MSATTIPFPDQTIEVQQRYYEMLTSPTRPFSLAAKDREITDCLAWDAGLTIIRFRYDADWRAICADHTHVFGQSNGAEGA